MKVIVGHDSGWLHMLVWLGLFGLIASFHGIIMGYSRQIFALSRAGYMPTYFSKVNHRFSTPHRAVILGGVIGILAIFSDSFIVIGGQPLTANIITMSVFGALLMYIIAMLSLLKLRRSEPNLDRPFTAPLYPFVSMHLIDHCGRGFVGDGLVQHHRLHYLLGHLGFGLCVFPLDRQSTCCRASG